MKNLKFAFAVSLMSMSLINCSPTSFSGESLEEASLKAEKHDDVYPPVNQATCNGEHMVAGKKVGVHARIELKDGKITGQAYITENDQMVFVTDLVQISKQGWSYLGVTSDQTAAFEIYSAGEMDGNPLHAKLVIARGTGLSLSLGGGVYGNPITSSVADYVTCSELP